MRASRDVIISLSLLAASCGWGTKSEAEFVTEYGVGDLDYVPFTGEDMLEGSRARKAMDAVMARVGVTPMTSRLLSAHFRPTDMNAVIGVKGQALAFDHVSVNVDDEIIDPSPERVDEDDVTGQVFDGNAIPYDRFPAMRLAAAKALNMTINQVGSISIYVERRRGGGDVVVTVSADDRRTSGTATFSTDGALLVTQGGVAGLGNGATSTSTVVNGVTTTVTVETSK